MSKVRIAHRIVVGVILTSWLAVCAMEPAVVGGQAHAALHHGITAAPTVAATATQTSLPAPNITSTGVITAVAALPPAFLARLPKDEQGRVIGGPYVPYLNYSPTMIAGRKCPRLTKWTWKVVPLDAPLRPYGQVDDPCVIQNAVDDFVRTEFADPAVNTPASMKKIEPLYATDPAIVDGLMPAIRDSYLRYYREGKTPYYACDKPRFKLLDVSPRSPLIANNDGKVSGNAIQLTVFVVSQNIDPFTCQLLSLKDNTRISTLTKTAAQLRGKQRVLQVNLLWNPSKAHWVVFDFSSAEMDNFYQAAKALWDAAPFKP